MRAFIPTEKYEGLQSKIFDHFGRAPYFIIYDIKKDAVDVIVTINKFHPIIFSTSKIKINDDPGI